MLQKMLYIKFVKILNLNKNLKYLITDSNGKILKNSFDLEILLKNTNWKNLRNKKTIFFDQIILTTL